MTFLVKCHITRTQSDLCSIREVVVDYRRFVDAGADGESTLDQLKELFPASAPAIPVNLQSGDHNMNDAQHDAADVNSDQEMSDISTLTIIVTLLYRLISEAEWKMKKCNYASSLADFHRNKISFQWVLGHLCRSYGIENPEQFGSFLKHALIKCEHPGVANVLGLRISWGLYQMCKKYWF